MAKSYRVDRGQRAVNAAVLGLARCGLGQRYLHVLSVTGWTSGTLRSVPVDVMDLAGERYLVAPYGEVGWVRRLRVAKRAMLRPGRATGTYRAVEVDAAHAVPVTKACWDIDERSSDADVRAEAQSHPVFRLSRHPA